MKEEKDRTITKKASVTARMRMAGLRTPLAACLCTTNANHIHIARASNLLPPGLGSRWQVQPCWLVVRNGAPAASMEQVAGASAKPTSRDSDEGVVCRMGCQACDTVAELAAGTYEEVGWPELLPFIFACVSAEGEPRLQESALLIFGQVRKGVPCTLSPHHAGE